MKETDERYSKRVVVKLPESAYQQLKEKAFQKGVGMAEIARKALFKRDGSLRV